LFPGIISQLAFRACFFIASNRVRQIPRLYISAQPSVPLPPQCNATIPHASLFITAYAFPFLEPILHVSPSQCTDTYSCPFSCLQISLTRVIFYIKPSVNPPPWPPGSLPVASSRPFLELSSSDLLLSAQWPLQKFAARMSFWSSSRTSLAPRCGRGVLK
jgi:hypothetical protein